ncbi:B-cell receptor CD22-like isoform X2 [Echeneis naucrates]|uniref:B-cell receptor CD22-like isoform X2 n=1 Tax=Echeneis naucrates TaxID=173247 RepID=UPI00111390B7|nr:B-cell receptor CD22-like isoform X2 [Echeneis naucrates]
MHSDSYTIINPVVKHQRSTTAMVLGGIGCVFIGLVLYISGVSGQVSSICALEGLSVALHCNDKPRTSNNKWYTLNCNGNKITSISARGRPAKYNMSENSQPTLTIQNLRENDAKHYCCFDGDDPEVCKKSAIHLKITDLQVKVIPATEKHTVTLVCSTSCSLTETPAAYIWYKNNEIIYEDWSPWYQELVHSEDKGRYSCAIKGYKGVRAPEVSVGSVIPNCINVTYAKGRMCKQTSVEKSCSITYPSEVHVRKSPQQRMLTCDHSCQLTDPQAAYRWYHNGKLLNNSDSQTLTLGEWSGRFSCALKEQEDVMSSEVCVDESCWSVKYANSRICALRGSSVNISSLKVKMSTAAVKEGERVTLICSTSCPLPESTTYIWNLNGQPLTPPLGNNKVLVLDPVSSQHAGNYSCAANGNKSSWRLLRVVHPHTILKSAHIRAAVVGACVALLVIIPLMIYFWIRRKRNSDWSTAKASEDNEQSVAGPLYDNISAQPDVEDYLYSSVHFSKHQTETLHSTLQPHQPDTDNNCTYSIVKFKSSKTH